MVNPFPDQLRNVLFARPIGVFLDHSCQTRNGAPCPGGCAMLPRYSCQLQNFGAVLSIRLERVSGRHTVNEASKDVSNRDVVGARRFRIESCGTGVCSVFFSASVFRICFLNAKDDARVARTYDQPNHAQKKRRRLLSVAVFCAFACCAYRRWLSLSVNIRVYFEVCLCQPWRRERLQGH